MRTTSNRIHRELDFSEVLANTMKDEWQKSISGRLEVMRGYLAQEAWQKGIAPYLSATLGSCLRQFMRNGGKPEYRMAGGSDYMRGFVAAIELLLSLPASVDAQIEQEEKKTESSGPRGQAGY
jgi:hypothetical protein